MFKTLIFCLGCTLCVIAYFWLDRGYLPIHKFTLDGEKNDFVSHTNISSNYTTRYKPEATKTHSQVSSLGNIDNLANDQSIATVLDADDTTYVFDNGREENAGPTLNADDTSYVFDNQEEKNIGPIIDADDVTYSFDNGEIERTGAFLNAKDEGGIFDNSPEQNIGAVLDIDNEGR